MNADSKPMPVAERNYRWEALSRAIRPYAFAVALATTVLVWIAATRPYAQPEVSDISGYIILIVAALSVVLLFYGYWGRREQCLQWGLLLSTGVWAAAGTIILMDTSMPTASALLSYCWSIGSAGAWMLEVQDTGGDV